jgi:2-polyprenyl-3-methyl-5-hydroxy-6-metoxy-1,4-benzoquinol methylase
MGLLSSYLTKQRTARVEPYAKGVVLDLGCGRAVVLQNCAQTIDSYYGVDHGEARLDDLKKSYPESNFFCRNLNTDTLDFDMRFDTILLIAVIEHISNQTHLAEQLARNLKPGGRIVITTPTPWGDRVHRLGARIGLFAASAVDSHVVIYNRKKFETLADACSLRIEKYKTFQFGCNQLVVLTKDAAQA